MRNNLQVHIQVKGGGIIDKKSFSFKIVKKNINNTLSEFKSRFIVTKAPNIVEIVYGRKVGYKVKISTKPYFRNISASKIRKDLRKEVSFKIF